MNIPHHGIEKDSVKESFYNSSLSFSIDSSVVAQLVAKRTTVCVSSYFSQKP